MQYVFVENDETYLYLLVWRKLKRQIKKVIIFQKIYILTCKYNKNSGNKYQILAVVFPNRFTRDFFPYN